MRAMKTIVQIIGFFFLLFVYGFLMLFISSEERDREAEWLGGM